MSIGAAGRYAQADNLLSQCARFLLTREGARARPDIPASRPPALTHSSIGGGSQNQLVDSAPTRAASPRGRAIEIAVSILNQAEWL